MKKLILIALSLTSMQSFALTYNCNYTVLDQGSPAREGTMKIDISRRKISSDIFSYDYKKSECELGTEPKGIIYLSCESTGTEFVVLGGPDDTSTKYKAVAVFNEGNGSETSVTVICTKR